MLSIHPRSDLLQKHFPVHFPLSNILNILGQRQKRMQTITSLITWGNTKRTKGEIHPSAEGHKKTHVSKPSSDSEWFSQQSKQQIPHRGKKKKKLFCFPINQVSQLPTPDVVMCSVLSVHLSTPPAGNTSSAADEVTDAWILALVMKLEVEHPYSRLWLQ